MTFLIIPALLLRVERLLAYQMKVLDVQCKKGTSILKIYNIQKLDIFKNDIDDGRMIIGMSSESS